jgi:hypothetical protein
MHDLLKATLYYHRHSVKSNFALRCANIIDKEWSEVYTSGELIEGGER